VGLALNHATVKIAIYKSAPLKFIISRVINYPPRPDAAAARHRWPQVRKCLENCADFINAKLWQDKKTFTMKVFLLVKPPRWFSDLIAVEKWKL